MLCIPVHVHSDFSAVHSVVSLIFFADAKFGRFYFNRRRVSRLLFVFLFDVRRDEGTRLEVTYFYVAWFGALSSLEF